MWPHNSIECCSTERMYTLTRSVKSKSNRCNCTPSRIGSHSPSRRREMMSYSTCIHCFGCTPQTRSRSLPRARLHCLSSCLGSRRPAHCSSFPCTQTSRRRNRAPCKNTPTRQRNPGSLGSCRWCNIFPQCWHRTAAGHTCSGRKTQWCQ